MPTVHIYGFDRSVEVKRNVVKGITEVMCREYKVLPGNVIVNIIVMEKDHVAHGGMLVADREAADPAALPVRTGGNG